MKTKEQIEERIGVLLNSLKRLDTHKKENEKKILAFSSALRELEWVISDD